MTATRLRSLQSRTNLFPYRYSSGNADRQVVSPILLGTAISAARSRGFPANSSKFMESGFLSQVHAPPTVIPLLILAPDAAHYSRNISDSDMRRPEAVRRSRPDIAAPGGDAIRAGPHRQPSQGHIPCPLADHHRHSDTDRHRLQRPCPGDPPRPELIECSGALLRSRAFIAHQDLWVHGTMIGRRRWPRKPPTTCTHPRRHGSGKLLEYCVTAMN